MKHDVKIFMKLNKVNTSLFISRYTSSIDGANYKIRKLCYGIGISEIRAPRMINKRITHINKANPWA